MARWAGFVVQTLDIVWCIEGNDIPHDHILKVLGWEHLDNKEGNPNRAYFARMHAPGWKPENVWFDEGDRSNWPHWLVDNEDYIIQKGKKIVQKIVAAREKFGTADMLTEQLEDLPPQLRRQAIQMLEARKEEVSVELEKAYSEISGYVPMTHGRSSA